MWCSSSPPSRLPGSCRASLRWSATPPGRSFGRPVLRQGCPDRIARCAQGRGALILTTDDQIEIDVRDDAAAMTQLFTLPAAARMDALAAMRGISAFDEHPMKMLKQIHEQGDGFRVAVDDPRDPGALRRP